MDQVLNNKVNTNPMLKTVRNYPQTEPRSPKVMLGSHSCSLCFCLNWMLLGKVGNSQLTSILLPSPLSSTYNINKLCRWSLKALELDTSCILTRHPEITPSGTKFIFKVIWTMWFQESLRSLSTSLSPL